MCALKFDRGLAKPQGERSFTCLCWADAGGFADASDVQVIHGPLLVGLSKVRRPARPPLSRPTGDTCTVVSSPSFLLNQPSDQ